MSLSIESIWLSKLGCIALSSMENYLFAPLNNSSSVVGQGSFVSAKGAGGGGGCLAEYFSLACHLLSLCLPLGDGPIQTEILSKRAATTPPPP